MDFRLQKAIDSYLQEMGVMGGCDRVSVAGAIKDLVQGSQDERNFILKQIETSSKLHAMSVVILMAHTDCGAYGGSKEFGSHKNEIEFHTNSLKMAETLIKEHLPEIRVKKVIAEIKEDGNVIFNEVV